MDRVTRVLAGCQYVLLTTFTMDGTPVSTPLRVAGDGGSLAVWPVRDPGVVECLTNNAGVELVPCDVRGIPRGKPVAGRARVADREELSRVRELFMRKYGYLTHAFPVASRIRQGEGDAIALSITVGPLRNFSRHLSPL